MEEKLKELTDKLFQEGVEKGQAEAKRVIVRAQDEAKKIIENARNEARALADTSKKEGEEFKRKIESDLKLCSRQVLDSVKKSVEEVVTAGALSGPLTQAFSNPDTLKELLKALLQHWDPASPALPSLTVLLPEAKRVELEKSLRTELASVLDKGVKFEFSQEVKNGFQVFPDNGAYRISFTDQDFLMFFKQQLKPLSRKFLFNE